MGLGDVLYGKAGLFRLEGLGNLGAQVEVGEDPENSRGSREKEDLRTTRHLEPKVFAWLQAELTDAYLCSRDRLDVLDSKILVR